MTRNFLMRKFGEIPVMIYNYRMYVALILAAALLLVSCKKKGGRYFPANPAGVF